MVVLCVSFVHVYVTLNPSSSGSVRSTLQDKDVSVCTEEEGEIAILLRTGARLMTLTELDDVTSSPLKSVAVIKQLMISVGDAVVGVRVRDVLLPSVVFCVSFVHV